jgi:hypothetical protein
MLEREHIPHTAGHQVFHPARHGHVH